jgi:hypothetical protein
LFFIVSSSWIRSEQSCMRSLSEEQITTRKPAATAWRATVAMVSSASTPGTDSTGSPNASTTR